MPLKTYRIVREKCYTCDTLIKEYDSLIIIKDSIINDKDKNIESYKMIIDSKDTTIQDLRKEYNFLVNKKAPKWWERKETWISALVGLLLGVAITR